ncbi:MAG: AI-2E family transporter [Verrucomicrobiota bacterium]
MSLRNFFYIFVITVGFFFILWIGKGLLIPLVVAIFLFYLILILSDAIQRIGYGNFRIPARLAIPTALLLIILLAGFLANLITENIRGVTEAAPLYEENLQRVINNYAVDFGVEDVPTIRELLGKLNFSGLFVSTGAALRDLVADAGLILIYLLFLMMERRTFSNKMEALLPESQNRERVVSAINQVRNKVETYVGIKTINSAVTGVLSYLVLKYVELDFASFWGVIIFVLNFIPTIGSLIATALPAILAGVQFEDPTRPFFTTLVGVGIIQFSIGNVLEPRLMGGSLNLSPLVILLSLALWGTLWGIPGMLLCVPFTVIAAIIAKEVPQARPLAIVLSGDGQLDDGDLAG